MSIVLQGEGLKESRNATILRSSFSPVASKAYELLAFIQQFPCPFHAFSFGIDANQRFCAGEADEQPGLVSKEEAKTICGIYFGHS